jgi:putative hydrolase of the HAD superfamily
VIRAIFFDAAGTLFHLGQSPGENYAKIARQLGVEFSPSALDRGFRRAWREMPRRPAIDGPRENDDKEWWRQLVEVVLAELPDIPVDFNRALFFELAYVHFTTPGVWILYPDVRDVLEMLAPKFQLGIISNFDRRLDRILQHLKIASYFSHVFVSSELGADKPNPEIYRRALARTGCRAGEAVHVGDDPERDWNAAANAGMHVFKLDRARNSLRDLPGYLATL